MRTPPDHHAIRARGVKRTARIRGGTNITICYHWYVYCFFDLGNRRPIGATFVKLTTRAPVDDHHLNAGGLGPFGQLVRIVAVVIPTQSGFQRHRYVHRLNNGLDQAQGMIQIAQECRAGIPTHDLFRGAPHINVDHLGTVAFDQFGGLCHPNGIATSKLDRRIFNTKTKLGLFARRPLALHQFLRCDHLAHNKTGTETGDQCSERQIGDSRQRSEKNRFWDISGPNTQDLAPIHCASTSS